MKHFEAWGAGTVTASLMLLVYALTETTNAGWTAAHVLGTFAASAVLMAIFLTIELRSRSALVPLGIFRRRTLSGANLIGFGLGTMIFGMFFLLSLYMQNVLEYSAIKTGIAYLSVALTVIAAATISQILVTRLGVRPVLVTGMALLMGGLIYFSQVSSTGSYLGDLLPGFLVIGIGMGFSFVPISIAALAGIQGPEALTNGFGLAFLVAAGFALVSLITTLVVLKGDDLKVTVAEPAPVPA